MPEVEQILSDLIKINTVNPPGNETAVAMYLKRLCDGYQIPNETMGPSPERHSFVATTGQGKKSLLYLAHTDVVPVADGWDFPAFSGDIKDGFVYGRGALDCKGLTAAATVALINLAQEGKLKGKLIFGASAGEETGGVVGAKFLADNYRNNIKADYTLSEGGWEPLKVNGKVCHFIQVGEKGTLRFKLKTRGVSAHSSLPTLGDNANLKMARIFNNLGNYRPEISISPEVKALIQNIAALEGFKAPVTGKNIDDFIAQQEDKMLGAYISALTRMTVGPDVIQGGIKANIIPDLCEAEIDIRMLPGETDASTMKTLAPLLEGAEWTVFQYSAPNFTPADTEFYRLIASTLKEFVGDAQVLPCLSAGATDARHLRPAGIPCYGINMMTLNLDPALGHSVHGRNEKIDIASLKLKAEFLTRLAARYLNGA
jgi:acetylornithine deacetylase/succinyl-diaminopimelate desuccinylase-like protein